MSCLYILKINPFSVVSLTIIFFHSEGCLFTLLIVSFAVQKLLNLIRSYLFNFVFISITLGGESQRILLWFMPSSVLPMLSSKSFLVSGLTFRSLIHSEFIFLYGVRKCSHFILLHVAVQFSQQHFIEEAVFAPFFILASFVKNKVPIDAWVYFWAFYLVPFVYISVFVPVPYCLDDCSLVILSKVRKIDSFSSILLSQDCFDYSGSFCFHLNCEIFCSSSVKNAIGNLIGVALNL